MSLWPALLLALALPGSFLSVGVVIRCARRWGIVDVPNERSSHSLPVPVGGGVALVAINLAGWLLYAVLQPDLPVHHAVALALGAGLIATVSLIDDLGHVRYELRLSAHAAGALILIVAVGYWHAIELALAGTIALGSVGAVVTFFWIAGLTNAFNFMDGLDGMAAGQAIAAGLGWTVLGLATHHDVLAVIGALLTATSLGFVIHNWHPARIFMGDVGSTFLGYSFAALPVIASQWDARFVLAGVLLVWPAIFDSTFTVLRRLSRHERIFVGHRTFLFHRLLHAGWSQPWAAALYTVLPLAGALLAFTWQEGNHLSHAFAGLAVLALCTGLWLLVRHEEHELERSKRLTAASEDTVRVEA